MSHKLFYQISAIVIFTIAGLLIGVLAWRHKANQNVLIEQEQAIQNAVQACNSGYGLQPMEQPTETEARLTTWGKTSEGSHSSDPGRPVWVVTMKGRWLLVGGPQPDPASNPNPSYWNECIQIIDAKTGESLSIPIQ